MSLAAAPPPRKSRVLLWIGRVLALGVLGALTGTGIWYFDSDIRPRQVPTITILAPGHQVLAGERVLGTGKVKVQLSDELPHCFRVDRSESWSGLIDRAFPRSEHLRSIGGTVHDGVANGHGYRVVTCGSLILDEEGRVEAVLYVSLHWSGDTERSCGFFRFRGGPSRAFDTGAWVRRSWVRRVLDTLCRTASLDAIEITPLWMSNDVEELPRNWREDHPNFRWAEEPSVAKSGGNR